MHYAKLIQQDTRLHVSLQFLLNALVSLMHHLRCKSQGKKIRKGKWALKGLTK